MRALSWDRPVLCNRAMSFCCCTAHASDTFLNSVSICNPALEMAVETDSIALQSACEIVPASRAAIAALHKASFAVATNAMALVTVIGAGTGGGVVVPVVAVVPAQADSIRRQPRRAASFRFVRFVISLLLNGRHVGSRGPDRLRSTGRQRPRSAIAHAAAVEYVVHGLIAQISLDQPVIVPVGVHENVLLPVRVWILHLIHGVGEHFDLRRPFISECLESSQQRVGVCLLAGCTGQILPEYDG